MARHVPKNVKVGKITARVRRVRPPGEDDGRFYWQGYVVEARKRRTVWSGWATVDEVAEALAGVLQRGIPAPKKVMHTEGEEIRTVSDLCRAWLAEQEDRKASLELKPRSYTNYYQAVCRIDADAIGGVSVDRIDQTTMLDWKHRRLRAKHGAKLDKTTAPNTLLAEYKALRMSWKFGLDRGVVPARTLPTLQIAAKGVRPKVTPESGEIQKLLRRLDGWVRVALWLQFSTGARISEIAAVRWKHVDLDEHEPCIYLEAGKTGPRTVPISQQCRAVLEAIEPKWPELYVTGRTQGTVRKMHQRLGKLCDELEIPRFTSHGIRRLAIELFVDSGVDVRAAADLLGNSPKTIWESYKQTTPKGARAAVRMAQLGYVAPEPEGTVIALDDRRKK